MGIGSGSTVPPPLTPLPSYATTPSQLNLAPHPAVGGTTPRAALPVARVLTFESVISPPAPASVSRDKKASTPVHVTMGVSQTPPTGVHTVGRAAPPPIPGNSTEIRAAKGDRTSNPPRSSGPGSTGLGGAKGVFANLGGHRGNTTGYNKHEIRSMVVTPPSPTYTTTTSFSRTNQPSSPTISPDGAIKTAMELSLAEEEIRLKKQKEEEDMVAEVMKRSLDF